MTEKWNYFCKKGLSSFVSRYHLSEQKRGGHSTSVAWFLADNMLNHPNKNTLCGLENYIYFNLSTFYDYNKNVKLPPSSEIARFQAFLVCLSEKSRWKEQWESVWYSLTSETEEKKPAYTSNTCQMTLIAVFLHCNQSRRKQDYCHGLFLDVLKKLRKKAEDYGKTFFFPQSFQFESNISETVIIIMLFREKVKSTMNFIAVLVISSGFFSCNSAKYHHYNQGNIV